MEHQHLHTLISDLNTAPPTPSMTDGCTQSDVSTVSSYMSSSLDRRIEQRRRELQQERRVASIGASPDKGSTEVAEDSISVNNIIKGNKESGRYSIEAEMAGRRGVSLSSNRKTAGQMGFREQEQYVSKLDKQNFDLKLRIYHQEVKIKEQEKEVRELKKTLEPMQKNHAELMRLLDDQQNELDKREGSLKEAVDAILLLQDKNRHLEKQCRRLAAKLRDASSNGRPRIVLGAKGDSAPREEQSQSSPRSHTTLDEQSRPSTARTSSAINEDSADFNNEAKVSDASRLNADSTLSVPFIEELEEIDQDRHCLRARTMSALSRYTDESHQQVDRYMPKSPVMSVLSEGDFESVYNFKDEPAVSLPKRRYSADTPDIWSRMARSESQASEYSEVVEEDTLSPEAGQEPEEDEAVQRKESLPGGNEAPSHQPETPHRTVPDLDVWNSFSRRTPASQSANSYHTATRRLSDSQLSVSASVTRDDSPPHGREKADGGIGLLNDSGFAPRIRREEESIHLTPSRPDQSKVALSKTSTASHKLASPMKHAGPPVTPASRRRHRAPGYFENYGFLDSQPTTPQLLYQASPQRQRLRSTPTRPASLSVKDQRILEHIAEQRFNDWIHPSTQHLQPSLAGPMFEAARASPNKSSASQLSHESEGQRASGFSPKSADPPPYSPTRENHLQRSQRPLLTHRATTRTMASTDSDVVSDPKILDPSLFASRAAHDSTMRVLGRLSRESLLAGRYSRESAHRVEKHTSPRKQVNFNPTISFSDAEVFPAEEAVDDDPLIGSIGSLPETSTTGIQGEGQLKLTKATRHPPVSLSAATGRRFAGFMRRRGSSGAGTSAPAESVAAGTLTDSMLSTTSTYAGNTTPSSTGTSTASGIMTPATNSEVSATGACDGVDSAIAEDGGPSATARRRSSFGGLNGRLGRVLRR